MCYGGGFMSNNFLQFRFQLKGKKINSDSSSIRKSNFEKYVFLNKCIHRKICYGKLNLDPKFQLKIYHFPVSTKTPHLVTSKADGRRGQRLQMYYVTNL